MKNPKIILKKTKRGKGVFAIAHIKKGEALARYDGPFYDFATTRWTDYLADHVIMCGPGRYRGTRGIAKYFNHSCEPNCGIKQRYTIVAMRDIAPGEECTWDYEMTEDNDPKWWSMHCRCGAPSCRKVIGAYRNMPPALRKKYRGYISAWLLKKQD